QTSTVGDLSFLEPQPVALHRPKDLLDTPAQAIEPHDFLRGRKFIRFSTHRQRRQQAPDDRLAASWRIVLAHLDIGERHRHGIVAITVARLGNAYSSSFYTHLGNPPGIAR